MAAVGYGHRRLKHAADGFCRGGQYSAAANFLNLDGQAKFAGFLECDAEAAGNVVEREAAGRAETVALKLVPALVINFVVFDFFDRIGAGKFRSAEDQCVGFVSGGGRNREFDGLADCKGLRHVDGNGRFSFRRERGH